MKSNENHPVCPYCETELSQYSKYCSNCTARIPDGFLSEAQQEAVNQDNSENDPMPIPRPGDLVGALSKIIERILAGELEAQPLLQSLPEIKSQVTEVFAQVTEELAELPEEIGEYKNSLQETLLCISKMFELSLSEMETAGQDGDVFHLSFGRFLAQRAELEYIELLKSMKMESTMNPFANETSVFEQMASRLQRGEETSDNFKKQIETLEDSVNKRLKEAGKILNSAMEKAKKYDGTNDTVMIDAIKKISEGINLLSGIIINLYNPEEAKEWLEREVRKTVDEMEESGELVFEN